MIDWKNWESHCVLPPKQHQREGVREIVLDTNPDRGRVVPAALLLADEVGAGKTKQVIDAAHILFLLHYIDTVCVITPGFARSTWADDDPLLGEVAKHAWVDVHNIIHEFHKSYTELEFEPGLNWVVTNYEFIRREERLEQLLDQLRGRKMMLVCDESWAIKSAKSDQFRACYKLRRKRADRVVLLNGTPLADGSPKDLYAQMRMLDDPHLSPEEGILGVKNMTHFRSKYVALTGEHNKVLEWKDLDDLNKRVAPYILARKTRECFDLPEMLPPQIIEARLTEATWKIYREMRDELVAWLGTNTASIARQAIVRTLRLAQITSGYLGGLESVEDDAVIDPGTPEQVPDYLKKYAAPQSRPAPQPGPVVPGHQTSAPAVIKEIGSEKIDALIHWFNSIHPPDKVIVWCRFRAELARAVSRFEKLYPRVFKLQGGQTKEDRDDAKRALAPGSSVSRACVVGNQGAGGASLNFSGASLMVYLSNDFSLLKRKQSLGRMERPGQRNPMLVVDVMAVGPKGQKTVDHGILKALRGKDDMANWTVDQWRRLLMEE